MIPESPDAQLLSAASRGDLPGIHAALGEGASPRARKDGKTALKIAASQAPLPCVLALIEAERADSAFHAFAERVAAKARDLLSACRSDYHPQWLDQAFLNRSRSALFFAASAGRIDNAKALLAHCDPLAPDARGATPLMAAASAQDNPNAPEAVRLLLPLSEPSARTRQGANALMMAACFDSPACVRQLLNPIDASAIDHMGATALHYAVRHASPPVIEALAAISPVDLANFEDRTPLDIAVERQDHAAIDLIAPRCGIETLNRAWMRMSQDDPETPEIRDLLKSMAAAKILQRELGEGLPAAPAASRPPRL